MTNIIEVVCLAKVRTSSWNSGREIKLNAMVAHLSVDVGEGSGISLVKSSLQALWAESTELKFKGHSHPGSGKVEPGTALHCSDICR